jgi:hypothetical protein
MALMIKEKLFPPKKRTKKAQAANLLTNDLSVNAPSTLVEKAIPTSITSSDTIAPRIVSSRATRSISNQEVKNIQNINSAGVFSEQQNSKPTKSLDVSTSKLNSQRNKELLLSSTESAPRSATVTLAKSATKPSSSIASSTKATVRSNTGTVVINGNSSSSTNGAKKAANSAPSIFSFLTPKPTVTTNKVSGSVNTTNVATTQTKSTGINVSGNIKDISKVATISSANTASTDPSVKSTSNSKKSPFSGFSFNYSKGNTGRLTTYSSKRSNNSTIPIVNTKERRG